MIESSRLGEVVGKTLLGRSGVRVGKVTDVHESTGSAGAFATVKTGLFGGHSTFVPLAEAELHGDNVHVPYPKELVDEAPRAAEGQQLDPAEEQRLSVHYGLEDGAPVGTAPGPSGDGSMTLSEERLHVGTERVETGRARLRKYVVTETVTQTVPVSHEELRVVREPLEPGDPDVPHVEALSEEVHEVVLSAERPVVQREVVAVERVRLATETVSGEETVTEQVRKERVEVEGDLPPAQPTAALSSPAVPVAPPADGPDSGTSSELFVAPREVETDGGSGTRSEFFLAPREDEGRDSGTGSELFIAPRESGTDGEDGTRSELFLAPREADPDDGRGGAVSALLAPREDEGSDGGTRTELFVAPREAERGAGDDGSGSELFIAPREAEPQDDSTRVLPQPDHGGATSSELFVAPRTTEPAGGGDDAAGTTTEFFVAPRQDEPER